MNNELLKLKSSLCDAIEKWINETAEKKDILWAELDTYIGDNTKELMTDAAFTVLLAQKNLTEYLKANGELK
jgi:hypothetical protein